MDENEVGEYKTIRANIRKVSNAIDEERKRIKKEYSAPLEAFEKDVKELTSMIDDVVNNLDVQIKSFDTKKREEKRIKIIQMINELELTQYETLIFNEKWLNTTTSEKSILEELNTIKTSINDSLETLKTIAETPNELAELEFEFKRTLNLANTISAYKAKKEAIKERLQTIKTEQIIDAPKYSLKFEIIATATQIEALKEFLNNNGIEFKRI